METLNPADTSVYPFPRILPTDIYINYQGEGGGEK